MSSAPASTEATLLASLTHLMAHWSSTATQAEVAVDADVAIDPIHIPALYILGLQGPSRAGDLASALHVTRPTMSKQLILLERAGLIERHTDSADRRVTIIRLSPTGANAHQRLVARGVEMLHHAIADWSDDEATQFISQFGRFVDALGNGNEPTGGEPAAGNERP